MSIFSKIQQVEKLSSKLRSLYFHKVIRNIGIGLVYIFDPIFIYVLSQSLEFTLICYGLISLFYFSFLPIWAKILKFVSMHILMMIGTLLTATHFMVFYFLAQEQKMILGLIGLLILFSILSKLFYWVPYHIDLARFINKHHRGRQLSFLTIIIALIGIILPLFSAFIISKFGFPVLFILAIVVTLISILPIFFIPHTIEKYSFGYLETFKKLFSKGHYKTNLAYLADGFQSHIGFLIWPIFIFMILKGEYINIGLISAAIILVGCILRYITGEVVDRFDKKQIMKTCSVLYSFGWVLKALSSSGLHIFLAGVYHDLTFIFLQTPFDVLTYEIAADEGHYIDEFTVLKEMSLHLGRFLMVVFSLILLSFVSLIWVFVLGAIVSLLVNLISKEEFYFARNN